MLKAVLLISLLYFSTLSQGQQRVIDVGKSDQAVMRAFFAVGGEPFSTTKYVKVVEGTPYFREEWMRGSLVVSDSMEYVNMRLRLDLLANDVEFIDKKGEILIATSSIREIRLVDSLTGNSFRFIHSSAIGGKEIQTGWYQVLTSGKATLYKKIHKQLDENRPYSSATTEQRISNINQYFILFNGSFTRVKKIKDVPDLFPDNKTVLSNFINSNKLSGKTDSDYISLVNEYNQQASR
ncbi:MAG TPA: hypothetical protein VF476_17675 [Chitinophagaceae bacterium]